MDQPWAKRRWYDFRLGHSVYLIFLLSFSNFILISHRLLIERIEFLDEIFSNLFVFILIFVAIYIPVATLIGVWHRKSQQKIDNEVWMRQNPLLAKLFRVVIDVQTKQITDKELEDVRNLLKKIEAGEGQSTNL